MVSIRRATIDDLLSIQHCNLQNLPENYTFKYYLYHKLSWPYILYLAEVRGKVVGYALSKLEEESEALPHGHITSISVLRTFRKLGLGFKLMEAVNHDMQHILGAQYVSLHVRESNRAALGLYRDRLKYEVIEKEEGYYADGESAYMMVKFFEESARSVFSNKKKSRKEAERMKMGEGEHQVEDLQES